MTNCDRNIKIEDKGCNNAINIAEIISSNSVIQIAGNNNEIILEEGVELKNVKVKITGNNNKLLIQTKAIIKPEAVISLINGGTVRIGRRTRAASGFEVIANRAKISIGHDCMIARGVCLRSSDMHSIFDIRTGKKLNVSENIFVDNYVWLCRNATILKGCMIGSGSIVGCESVVTKDVPQCSIAAGNPARIVKTNIIWGRKDLANTIQDDNLARRYLNTIELNNK